MQGCACWRSIMHRSGSKLKAVVRARAEALQNHGMLWLTSWNEPQASCGGLFTAPLFLPGHLVSECLMASVPVGTA